MCHHAVDNIAYKSDRKVMTQEKAQKWRKKYDKYLKKEE